MTAFSDPVADRNSQVRKHETIVTTKSKLLFDDIRQNNNQPGSSQNDEDRLSQVDRLTVAE